MSRHTVTVLAAAVGLLVGACSNGGAPGDGAASGRVDSVPTRAETSSEQFCAGAAALYDELERAGTSDPTSPEVQTVFAQAQAMEVPPSIVDDWQAVLESMAPFVAGEVDLDDPDAMALATQRFTSAAPAYQRIGTYLDDECGFGTTTSAP
jgi:hypothetical protein